MLKSRFQLPNPLRLPPREVVSTLSWTGRNWLHTAWGSANMFRPLPVPLALTPQPLVGATRLTPALASPEPLRIASDAKPNEDCPNSCPEPFSTRSGNPLATETIGESCHPPTTFLTQAF